MRRVWRGRVRDRVWKTFVALAGQAVPTGELVRRVWPRRQRFETWQYYRVRCAASEIADPVRRASSKGRPWLWRLRPDYQELVTTNAFIMRGKLWDCRACVRTVSAYPVLGLILDGQPGWSLGGHRPVCDSIGPCPRSPRRGRLP
jgi:hypothetical protein